MAKGRRLTTSRSERLLGSYSSYSHDQGTVVADTTELAEDDVWSMVDDMVVNGSDSGGGNDDRSMNGPPRTTITSRQGVAVQEEHRHVGGLSLAFEDPSKAASARIVHQFRGHDSMASPCGQRQMATSAPMNVPDWSKIYRVDSVESMHDSDDDHEFEMVPPHEYLAREHRPTAANSVFVGVGRTLKGRDLSRVRDAVWSQTGFDG
ncbi:hypothetical protein ACSBR2_016117 [Camellia fascicularis]